MSLSLLRDLLFTLAFVGFGAVTLALLVLTVRNRLRTPDALLSWTDRRVWRGAVWPVGFVLLMGACAVVSAGSEGGYAVWQLSGLMLCGMCWLVSVVIAHTVLVTDRGIVTHLNHPERTVVWDEVQDYFEGGPAPWHYAFFHADARGKRCRQDVWVPRPLRRAFSEITEDMLHARFEVDTRESRRQTLG